MHGDYVCIGNVVETGALGSAPPASAGPDWLGSHIQHLRTKVHIDDPRSVVLVRFHREADVRAQKKEKEKTQGITRNARNVI